MDDPRSSSVAIIGMAGRFPGAPDVERFWENLAAGVESITFFSPEELQAVGVDAEVLADPAYVRARSVVSGAEKFDAAFFDLSPREAEVIDPQHRLLLECAWEALENAGHDPRRFPGTIGVFAGAGVNTYLLANLQHNREVMGAVGSFQAMLGSGGDFLSTRISYKLGLTGPSLTVQTACSTSLVAVHLAVQSLLNGECDMALAGGVRLLVPRKGGHPYQPGNIFSRDGHCRPFDAAATGTTEGEGLGLVVLRRLADAASDGDRIQAVILGSAINNDGAGKLGYTVPSVEGQSAVIALAQALSGIEAATIGLIEAHGTGTPLGDPIEMRALSQVFAGPATPGRRIAVGSLKSNLGHLDAAAGVASLIKAALAVERGVIPPSLHFERPNPQIDLAAGSFYVPVVATPWRETGPRRAGVSSFGIGGTNAHVVLEEAPEVPPGSASRPLQLLVLSARTPAALEQTTRNLAEHLGRHPELDLADVASTLQRGRTAFDARRIVVCGSTEDALVLATLDPKRVLSRTREAGERPVFFLFSGQGAQYPGMGAELYRNEPVFRAEVDRSAEILYPRLGLDLRQVLYPEGGDPAEAAARLEQTALAQPALFVVEYALARLWMAWGVRPEAMLGHSLGEYVAACLAGVFSLADALALVAERGRLMQEMPGGAMLAVQLPEAEVRPLLGGLSLAAVNGPAMCVVAGEPGEIAALAERLVGRGLEGRRLHTSHAFHSASMEPVLAPFAAAFDGLRLHAPAIPFVSNLTGTWIRPEEATSPAYWVRHLRETVRFSDGLAVLFGRPGAVFLEVGPGRALTSLVRQHPSRPGAPSVLASLPTAGDGRRADAAVLRTLGELWLAGVEIDWRGFHAGERRLRVPLPTYPFERQRYWVEPDTGVERVRRRAVRGEGGVDDWFWVPLWRQALPPANRLADGAEEGSWLLFADGSDVSDGSGLGDRLAARLRERGREVVMARAGEDFVENEGGDFALRPGSAADYGVLLDRLARRGIVPTRIVHLWSVGAATDVADAAEEQERGFYSLFHLARALGERRPADRRPPLHVGIVSTGVQRITGTDELIPVRATLLGPAATLPQEYPETRSVAIDVTLPPPGTRGERQLVDLLLAELDTAVEPVVAYRGTDRWLRVFEPLSLPPSPGTLPLRAGGTYLITGGLGGVGLELAGLLAREVQAKLVLVGRTPFPDREAWPALVHGEGRTARIARRLTELEAAGAEVWTAVADVTDRGAMLRVLDAARRRFGRIDGAIHAAGLPGGGLMQLRSPETAAAVLAPKVTGTLVLADLLAADPPDFLVLCSSLNALVGGLGQSDYAAANAFLDAFAQSRPGELPVVSINWDAWRDVGMADRRLDERLDEDTALLEAPMLQELRPFSHPLLHERGIDGEGSGVFVSRLCPREDWILDEHRLGGHPVVPGTAYLEMAGAAFRGMEDTAADGAFEIRDVQFIAPLRIGDDEMREVQTVLSRNGDGFHHFSVRSKSGGGWEEHVTGTIGAVPAVAAAPVDISSFTGWEEEVLGADYREDLKQAGLGPRWEVLKKIYRQGGELVGLLELAPEFQGDIAGFKLHPALFDAATSFAEYYVPGARGNYYLPLSYKQLHVRGPLPSRIYSRVRLHDADFQSVETLSFDVAVLDETGRERIRVDEFTMKRVDVSAALRGHAQKGSEMPAPGMPGMPGMPEMPPGLEESLKGMDPERAVEAFRRVLASGSLAQIAVSVRPLPEVFERARSLTVERLAASVGMPAGRHARPDLAAPYVAPQGELEERLAAIWSDVLGLDRVGAADDFFDLGGHSLLATQVISRVREAFGVEVPLSQIFEATTVADFAAVVEKRRDVAGVGGGEHGAIPRRPPGRLLELSFAQQRLWFLDLLDPGSVAYNMPCGIRLEGALDVSVLQAVFTEIVRRHETLRTSFHEDRGQRHQVVAPAASLPLPLVDLSALGRAERRESEAERLSKEAARWHFDLTRGPLLRTLVFRLAAEEHLVSAVMHHIASDGWSMRLFRREIWAFYPAFRAGLPSPLPELPIQYADYAFWQRDGLAGPVLASQLAYWRDQLAGAPQELALPFDRPRPGGETFSSKVRPFALPPSLVADLVALTRAHGATLTMTLLAGFEALLGRHTGQEDLTIGIGVGGRDRREIEPLIGFFVNSLVLRADLSGAIGFGQLVDRVRRVALEAYAHQDLPFDKLVEELQPGRSLQRPPFFQVMFGFETLPPESLEMPGFDLAFFAEELVETGSAKFDLTLSLFSQGGEMTGLLEYNAELFDGATIERLLRHFENLLDGAIRAPGTLLGDLPLLDPGERQQLVEEWNATGAAYPAEASLGELFAAQVGRTPDAVGLTSVESSLSYGELDRRANRLAWRLRRLGVDPEERVGLCLDRSLDVIVGLLGIVKAGGAYVPLDPDYPAERLTFLLADCGLRRLVGRRDAVDSLPSHGAEVVLLGEADRRRDPRDDDPPRGASGGSRLAYVMYTSGSTGRPKGVAVPHRGVVRLLHEIGYAELGPDEVLLRLAPVSFDASTFEIWGTLLQGARLVLPPEATVALADFGELIDRHGVTTLWLTTALFHLLVDHQLARLRPVRQILTGGEVMSPQHVRRVLAELPGTRLTIFYGPTENTTFTSFCPLRDPAEIGPTVPLGRPIPHTRTYVLDREGHPAPLGVSGELCTAGEGLARGYLGRPELTAERFLPDPFGAEPGGRLYRTGDLARQRPDGRLDFLGRIDAQVKLRGFRIEPGEIEARLREHPGVKAAAVTLYEQPAGNRFLVAYVVGDPVPTAALNAHLQAQLPEYMVPTAFVFLATLPLTPNGKVDRRRLPAPSAAERGEPGTLAEPGAVSDGEVVLPALASSPLFPVAELLAELWRDLLRVDNVERADNFFELGGYSLVATALSLRVREAFGIEISLHRLFDDPTLEGLVAEVEQALRQDLGAEPPPLLPVDRDGPLPLSFAQQRLWIIDQLEAGSTAYHVPLALRLTGELDPVALRRALGEILRRHEALRTRFEARDGSPHQVISPFLAPVLPRVDLTALAAGPREAELLRLLVAEVLRPFDLGRGPLLRSTLVALHTADQAGPAEHALLTTLHHIVSDGWSVGVLLRELTVLYGALRDGRPALLPALPIQYADFSKWQREWLSGAVLQEQIGYWRERLAGAPRVLDLPTDRPRPAAQSFRGATLVTSLPVGDVRALTGLARRHGVTLFMVLLAAFETLLYRLTGQDSLLVGSTIANRTRREIENLIGFFVNTLVMRADFPAGMALGKLLTQTRESALGAYTHQDLPFEKLVEELEPARDPSRSPFFQVVMQLQNAPLSRLALPGLALSLLETPGQTAKFDLGLSLAETADGLSSLWEYNTDLFDRTTVKRLAGGFDRLLAGIAGCGDSDLALSEARITALPLLSAAERQQLLEDWSGVAVRPRRGRCLHDLVAEQVAERPQAVAVVCGGESLSYGELSRRADRLARRLRGLGVGPEVKVGLFCEPSIERIVGLLGALRAGGAYVPLDPEHPPARLAWIVDSSGMGLALAQESLREKLTAAAGALPVLSLAAPSPMPAGPEEPVGTLPANLAYVIYTSGSTGRPNGVLVPHRGAAELIAVARERFRISPESRVAQVCSFTFDASVLEVFLALGSGATLVVARSEERLGAALAALLARQEITMLATPPPLLETLAPAGLALTAIAMGGDRCPAALARRWASRLALYNCYGPTETSIFSIYGRCREEEEGEPAIGRPVGGTEVYLSGRDPLADLVAIPPGSAGELLLGGAGLARGYAGEAERTAEHFVPHPGSPEPGARLYRTGDLARFRPDGRLEFLGRIDTQVKIRGVRIEPGEIEAVLAGHDGVRQAVVVAREDLPGGRGLVGFVVAREGSVPTVSSLRQHAAARLPEAMVPARLLVLAHLPTTVHGKVDRRALAEWSLDEAGEPKAPRWTAPRTPMEELLANLFADLLGREQVGIEDSFFELGGHSLLATRLISRVREAWSVDLPVRELFEHPTVVQLAARILQAKESAGGTLLPPIEPVRRGRALPLSFAQQRLWVLDHLEPGSTAYHLPLALRLTGALDPSALHRSLGEILRRHEALRTRFEVQDGSPSQVISPFVPPALPRVDLTALAAGAREAELLRLIETQALHPFDLGSGPLFRATLVALGVSAVSDGSAPSEHALLTTMHHIVSDGWSLGVLLSELTELYAARLDGRPARLPELPVQYADYAVWQRRWLSGKVLAREIAYWRRTLAGVPVLELPADRPRHWARSGETGVRSLVLPSALTAELVRLGRANGVTLFMVLLAAFDALLYRYTGQEDVAVGSPIANRTRHEIEGLVGFFVNTLVLRTGISPETGAVGLLKRVRETTLTAYAHQDVPFEKLVEELQPERGPHRSPFFQVLLALQNAPLSVRPLPGLTLTPLPSPTLGAKYELTLSMTEAGDGGLLGRVDYVRDLFDPVTVDRLMGHFTHLLAAFAATPEQAVGELPLLDRAERHQLLDEWNDSRRALPAPAVVHRLFAEQAARRPEAVALVAAGERITYSELDRRADRLARRLRRHGLPLEAAVGVLLDRSLEMMTAFLAVLKAGGAYVPLDPSYPVERLDFMLQDTQAPFVLTHAVHAGRLSGLGTVVLCLDGEEGESAETAGLDFLPTVDADNLAYILYTSGSTGRPKGVAVPHRAVVRLVRETDYVAFSPDEVVLQFAPVAFDASTFEIWGALLNGGQVALAPNAAAALADLGDLIDRHGITTVFLTTALFHLMVDHQLERLRPLRQVLTGGELMSPAHVRQALAGLRETRLTIFYGPTENTTFTSYCPLRDPAEVGASVPLGRPIANTRAYVLDDRDRVAPIGVVGELCAAGEGLARGYLNRPELTAEKFVPDPSGTGGRLYRTGDLARVLPDGRLDFLGRIDHQVKLRGFRIEPGEIEARLAEHPAVREATVVVHEQPVGNRFLVAYVVGSEAAEADLRAHLRAQLPEHMVPTAFVLMESLPLTPNGKVDRRRLPAPSTERPEGEPGMPADTASDASSEVSLDAGLPVLSTAPLFPVAELLAELWRDLLRIEDIGLADNFFELGGYSLVATALSLRVREAFGIEISLHRLFDDPTLGGLVAEVEEGLRRDRGAEPPPLVPVDRGGRLPLSFAQQRLWIVDQLEPGSTAYHVPLALRLTGELNPAALGRALGEIVRRHEALRTRFEAREGSPFQVIAPFVPPVLPRVDLTALGVLRGGRREEELLRLARAEALDPFDLSRGPLFRATLVALAASEPAEHALLTTMHHIISDGWSVGVLLAELTALYGAFKDGRPSPLPELPVQYADYAVWQRRWLSGAVLEREIAYWRQALTGVPVLELPVDRPRHWVRSGAAGTRSLVLPPRLAAELVQLGRQQGVTLFMVLLAAFEMLLNRYTGQEDVAVGSPIANRAHRETEGLVGFFVNTLVLRTACRADAGAREVLKRVRETALGAYSHQDVPFEKLVEELRPERGPHRSPFFQVFFTLQNAPLPARRLPELALAPLPVPNLGAKFELSLSMAEAEDGSLEGGIEYGRELFDPSTLDRLAGHFSHLLAAFAAAPERTVGELPLLAAAERHQLLAEWNDTRRVLPRPAVVHRLFAEQAAQRAEAVALLSATGERVSYGELDRRADRLARRLLHLGLAPEAPVGVFLERSPEMVTALLAVLKAGGAYLPLDPAYPAERLEFMLRDTRAPLVITQAAFADRLSGQGAAVVRIEDGDDGEVRAEGDPDLPAVDAANLAYVIYTSGSTGLPKGVCVVHEGIVRLVREGGFATLGADDVVLHVCPVSFDVATFEIWGALLSGSILSILPSGTPSLDDLSEAIGRDRVTSLWLTSGLFTLMVNHRLEALRPVRQILAGGDVVPLPQAQRVLSELPGCRLIDGYGPTENTTFTSCHPIWQGLAGRSSVPIGRPIGNTRVVILDGGLEPVPVGVAGELYTGGLGLARGYFERPDLTAQRFVPDAASGLSGERLYGTGDRARWLAEGTIEFLGRLDHQVKVRGFRIELGEIETVLGRHPAVLESVVVTREDRPGDRRLVAYVVPAAGLEPAAGELAGFLRQTLPEYMIPGVFVTLGSIPLSPNSKPDREALPPPPDVTVGTEASYVPPRSRLEERIAAVWREVLGVARVGVHDNFFSLGGHSLLLLQAVARLREEIGEEIGEKTGLPLTPIELFEYPTIAALAKRLAPKEEEEPGTSALDQSRDRGASRRQSLRRRPRGTA
jgi:amino acid adenylation domain-containing protein